MASCLVSATYKRIFYFLTMVFRGLKLRTRARMANEWRLKGIWNQMLSYLVLQNSFLLQHRILWQGGWQRNQNVVVSTIIISLRDGPLQPLQTHRQLTSSISPSTNFLRSTSRPPPPRCVCVCLSLIHGGLASSLLRWGHHHPLRMQNPLFFFSLLSRTMPATK